MKFCTNCGAQIADNAAFCANCGSAVRQSAPQPAPVDLDMTYAARRPAAPQQPAPQQAYVAPQPVAPQPAPVEPDLTYAAPQQPAPQQAYAEPRPVTYPSQPAGPREINTLEKITKIFMTIGVIATSIGTFGIGLIWCRPMGKAYDRHLEYGEPINTKFKICTLLFVNTVAGILMLVNGDK